MTEPIVFIDWETQGIPLSGAPSEDPRHPGAVSLTAILDDETGRTRRVVSTIISNLPPYEDAGALKVHGITPELADRWGRPLARVMDDLAEMIDLAEIVCAFNLFFDIKLAKIGCARIPRGLDIRQKIESKRGICAMEAAADHLIGRRRISLKNAMFELFKREVQTGLHGSLEDTFSCRSIYYELKKRGALPEPRLISEWSNRLAAAEAAA